MHLSTVTRQKSTTLGSTFFSPHGNQNTFLQFGQPFEKFPTRIPFFLESLKRYYSCTTDSRNRWSSERALEKKEERRENDSFSIRLMDIYYKRRTECKDAKRLKRNVYICPSSNSLFSGPLGLPSPQLWLILRLAFLSHRTGGRTSMGRAWRTKRNFVSHLTDKRNEGNIMYRFKQKIIIIKSDI